MDLHDEQRKKWLTTMKIEKHLLEEGTVHGQKKYQWLIIKY